MKPSIPELDNASPQVKNTFMSSIEKQFGGQINNFKGTLTNSLASKFNPQQYLSMLVM